MGKIPTMSVRRRISRWRLSLGLLNQMSRAGLLEDRDREDVLADLLEVLGHGAHLLAQGLGDPVELGVYRGA